MFVSVLARSIRGPTQNCPGPLPFVFIVALCLAVRFSFGRIHPFRSLAAGPNLGVPILAFPQIRPCLAVPCGPRYPVGMNLLSRVHHAYS